MEADEQSKVRRRNGLDGTTGSECMRQKKKYPPAIERQIWRYPNPLVRPGVGSRLFTRSQEGVVIFSSLANRKASKTTESCRQKARGRWEIDGSASTR